MADDEPITQEEAEKLAVELLAFPLAVLCDREKVVEFLLQPTIENRRMAGIGLGSALKRLPWIEASDWSCANLVEKAERGELLSIMAVRELAAELIERGQPLPKPLRRFTAKALRDFGGKSRRGRIAGENILRDIFFQAAYDALVSRGCNKNVALEAVYHAQTGRVKPMVDRDRLRRICSRRPGPNTGI